MELTIKNKVSKNLNKWLKDKIQKNYKLKNFLAFNILVFIDFLAFLFTLILISLTYYIIFIISFKHISLSNPSDYFGKFWWVFIVILFFMFYEKLYTERLPFWEETKRILKGLSISVFFTAGMVTILNIPSNTPTLTILLFWLYGIFVFPIFRLIGKKYMYKTSIGRDNLIILGAGEAGIRTAQAILHESHLGYKIVGFLDDDPKKIGKKLKINNKEFKIFGRTKSYKKFINILDIYTVVISIPSLEKEKLFEITNEIHKYAKKIIFVPDLQGIALLNTDLRFFFSEQLFFMEIRNNLKSKFNQNLKRSFDIILSVLSLPLLLPIIGIIGILVKLDSKGNIFFIQERLGKDGTTFRCIKFRTMYENNQEILENYLEKNPKAKQEWETFKKLKGFDPRVTRIGKFLRRTSLDELPQIFNVLKGEMSLVGPRPYLPREKEDMKEFYETIVLTKPGITGLWQVSGRNDLEFDYRLKLDTWYVQNWSLWLDVVIILKTFKVVLKGEGAY